HLVFTPLEDRLGNPFGLAEIMSGIKGASAHSVNKLLGRKGHVWQDESFDHILRRNENIQEKVEYICLNPVRKGLVADENDYPWLWREWLEGSDVAQPPTAGTSEKTHPGAGVLQGLHQCIAEAARELNEQRERWLNPPEWIKTVANYVDGQDDFGDVPEDARGLIRQSAIMAEAARDSRLKKRTLTNLYNERPTWLRLAHEKLDRGVLAAYAAVDPAGEWPEDWAEVWSETGAGQPLADEHPLGERRKQIDQQVLGNLLRLNLARAEASEES
ncbi:MAG TPA: hypothetical protein VM487_12505, partial [Phycisphaerae bacterium]|nr:hypothetical protein [Phycisphaerae bacterium]